MASIEAHELFKQLMAKDPDLIRDVLKMFEAGEGGFDFNMRIHFQTEDILKKVDELGHNMNKAVVVNIKKSISALDENITDPKVLMQMGKQAKAQIDNMDTIAVKWRRHLKNMVDYKVESDSLMIKISRDSAEKLVAPFESMISNIQKLPLGSFLADALDIKGLSNDVKTKITENLVKAGHSGTISFKDMGTAAKETMKGLGESIKAAASNWRLLAGAGILVLIVAVWKAFKKMQDITKQIAENTGLLYKDSKNLANISLDVAAQYAHMGVSLDVASKSASALVNEFQQTQMISKGMVASVGLMSGSLGVSEEHGAKLVRLFKTMGVSSDEQLKSTLGFVKNLALAGKVAPGKVMEDMAESANEIQRYMHGNYIWAAKAAVEARRMGLSLKDTASVADNLLDWDTSIEAVMEASIMVGRSIDMSGARYKAFRGDIVGATKDVLTQVGSLEKFNNLNVIAKDAMAKATGMEVSQLAKALYQQEELNKLRGDERAEYDKQLAIGKDLVKNNKISLIDGQKQANALSSH